MRIVQSFPHPSRDLDTDGSGQAVRARSLRDALRGLGHQVVTVTRDGDATDRAVVDRYRGGAATAVPQGLRLPVRDAGRLVYGWRHAARVADTVRRHAADVLVETHVAFSLSGARAAAATGVPLVIDDLAPIAEEHSFGVGLGRAADRVWRTVTARAHTLVAVNHTIRDLLAADVDDPSKLVVAGNGHDHGAVTRTPARRAEILTPLGVDPRHLVVVFVGSFLPWHRTDLLLDALATAAIDRPWHLLLVGDGPQRPYVQRTAAALGLADRVTCTGHLPGPGVAAHLSAADVGVLPATNDYGNPMKLVEYLAMGLAVVAPRLAPVEELCTHGETAWLFAPDDSGALASALRTLAGDAGLADRLGRAAAAAATDLTWDRQAQRLVDGIARTGAMAGPVAQPHRAR